MNVHSHYENLKVSRDAPMEVIKAAYKALSMLWHPDRSSDPRAPEIMRTINVAYDTLSDPIKRHEHDEWLAAEEMKWTFAHPTIVRTAPQAPEPARAPEPKPEVKPEPEPVKKHGRAFEIDEWLFSHAIPNAEIPLPLSTRYAIGACTVAGIVGLIGVLSVISHV